MSGKNLARRDKGKQSCHPRLRELSEDCARQDKLRVSEGNLPRDLWIVARTATDQVPIVPIYHHRFLLILAWSGAARLQLDQESVLLEEGDILLVLPYQFHHYTLDVPEKRVWLMLGFEGVEPAPYLSLRNRPLPMAAGMRQTAHEIVETRLRQDVGERYRNQHLALLFAGLLNDMLEAARLPRRRPREAGDFDNPALERMRRVADHVVAHRQEPMTIARLARHFAISGSYLRESFKSAIGVSLGDFIRRTRIHHTCRALLETDLTCSEIALEHGYSSLYTFSRSFKAEFGVSPTAYRRRLRPGRSS